MSYPEDRQKARLTLSRFQEGLVWRFYKGIDVARSAGRGSSPTQHRVSHSMWVATQLHYCVKKLWIARICAANCCGSYFAGFSTDRERVSIAFLITGSVPNDLPFFCATGTNVWTAMKACSATRNPDPAIAVLSPAMLRNSVSANCDSIFCAITLAKRA